MSKEELEEAKNKMCDKYCKFPEEIQDDDVLMAICRTCPLNRITDDTDDRR